MPLTVLCGPMYASKTASLIARLKDAASEGFAVLAFRPLLDTRTPGPLVSRNGASFPAWTVAGGYEIGAALEAQRPWGVGVDEAQFFPDTLAEVLADYAAQGLHIVAAGLDLDFRGKPFRTTADLMAVADEVVKCTAICACCGAPATRSYRKAKRRGKQILVGGAELYEARCYKCWKGVSHVE